MAESHQANGARPWSRARYKALLRQKGPASIQFRTRAAIFIGAIIVGVIATGFARAADAASELFMAHLAGRGWLPLLTTPLAFIALVWLTRRFAPFARGSGIPQVIAARDDPERAARSLISPRTAAVKILLTLGALLNGASVGREGPTVQLAGAVMGLTHRLMRVPLRMPVVIAAGAAGVAAAFNTPLAGLLFAIEELASTYEQRVTMIVITAIVIAGLVAQSIQGDYVYFGLVNAHMPIAIALIAVPFAGVAGGALGGLFARVMLAMANGRGRFILICKARPLLLAGACGAVVALIGILTGLTWGTGYAPARALIEGQEVPRLFGPAKFLSTLATALAGLPGGIFAPSLAVGAGLGNLLRFLLPDQAGPALIVIAMAGYFAGVVRAPLTAVIILSETTASRGLILPMFATAFIADAVSQRVCREKLYHGLSRGFAMPAAGHQSP